MCIARFMISVFHICMSLWLFCHSGLKPSYIGGVRHLWERGEEPWASSEAAASGHGSEEPWASSEAAASGHGSARWRTLGLIWGSCLRPWLYRSCVVKQKHNVELYTCMHAAVITRSSSFPACVLHFVLATWPPCGTNGDGCSAPSAKFGSRHWNLWIQMMWFKRLAHVESAPSGGMTCIIECGGLQLGLTLWC